MAEFFNFYRKCISYKNLFFPLFIYMDFTITDQEISSTTPRYNIYIIVTIK